MKKLLGLLLLGTTLSSLTVEAKTTTRRKSTKSKKTTTKTSAKKTTATKTTTKKNAKASVENVKADPVAEHCAKNGGKSILKEVNGNPQGFCKLKDGKEVDELQYYFENNGSAK